MTRPCPDADTLLAVAHALAWEGAAGVDHLAACPACRASLAALDAMHASVPAVTPDAALAPRVLASLAAARRAERVAGVPDSAAAAIAHHVAHDVVADEPAEVGSRAPRNPTRPARPARPRATPATALVFALATTCAWLALAFANAAGAAGGGTPPAAPTELLPLAALGGSLAAWRTHRAAALRVQR